MPIATLRFTLPDEDDEHRHALHGATYAAILLDLDNYLRGRLKYEEGLPEVACEALQATRDWLTGECEGLDLW